MDPLTHTLVGAAMATAAPLRRQPMALATLVAAANLPDIDVLAYVGGSDAALLWRRGWSHGPVGMLLLPPLLVALVVLWSSVWRRFGRFEGTVSMRGLLPWAWLAAISHPALDWLNSYGVRFLMPVDRRWFYGDTLFIVDPWLWLLLGAGLFLTRSSQRSRLWPVLAIATSIPVLAAAWSGPRLAGMIWVVGLALTEWIDRSASQDLRLRSRHLCFSLASVYVLVMVVASSGARSVVSAEVSPGNSLGRADLMVGPVPLSPLKREVILAEHGGYRLGTFSWLPRPHVEWAESLPRTMPDDLPLELAMEDPCIAGFANWARFPSGRGVREGDRWQVDVFDLRFGRRTVTGFGGVGLEVPSRE